MLATECFLHLAHYMPRYIQVVCSAGVLMLPSLITCNILVCICYPGRVVALQPHPMVLVRRGPVPPILRTPINLNVEKPMTTIYVGKIASTADNESNKENDDCSTFGLVTDEDKEADRDPCEKLTGMIEERIKNKPSPPPSPPPQIAPDVLVTPTSEHLAKSRDGDSDLDMTRSVEDRNDEEMNSKSIPSVKARELKQVHPTEIIGGAKTEIGT